jgi:hypothetical protein
VWVAQSLASLFLAAGVFLWATPLWYPLLMEGLYRAGIGYRRCGKLRRIRLTDWLNATGIGIFCGSLLFGLGNFLRVT